MFRFALALVLALPAVTVAQTHQVKLNGHTFTLPQGFTIELAAGADLAPRPIVCDFDEKGRLYVCDSSGSNANVKEQLEKKPHRIVRLEDTNGDGKYDQQTVYVKNVMFPEGAMWLNGSLFVAAPPHILKFTDTNDDGVADKEEIWFDGKTLTGCANDLHGPYRGPDGWIYWTKGAFAKQEHTVNGKKFSTRAAHIFRARPDGTGLEPVMTGGMDNPVDLVFTPGGDIIFSTTFFQHPRDGKRDGLIHAIHGAVYGKDHDPVYEHPWTHPTLMPPMTHMGPAAPCGLHRLESDQFGKDYANNIFCCQFNMRKVSRHILVPKGSTYETKDSDFVVSDNIDFHPTDVIEDADGSLLIVDTGGWYKLCCPTSQLVKPDVTGAIYRVKKVGAHKDRTKPVVELLPRLYTIAQSRDRAGLDEANTALSDPDPHKRRLAAVTLGRIGDPKAIPAMVTALADEKNDRALDHALTFALIEIGDVEATAKGLAHQSPRVRRAVLAALSNIPDAKLDAKPVLAELDSPDAPLRETAWWIAGRHPQWGGELAGYFREKLKTLAGLTNEDRNELAERLAKFAGNSAVQKLIGETAYDMEAQRLEPLMLHVMSRSGLKSLPDSWHTGLIGALISGDEAIIRTALAVFRAIPAKPEVFTQVTQAGIKLHEGGFWKPWSDELRMIYVGSAPAGALSIAKADFHLAIKLLDKEEPAPGSTRAAAAEALARAKLSEEQLVFAAQVLGSLSPVEMPRLIGLFEKSKDEKVGLALVAGLRVKGLRGVVRAEMVKPILDKYSKSVQAEAEKLYAELAEARAGETKKLETMLAQMKPGDIRRGQLVFNNAKTQCIACHKVGYVGGTNGPDLTKIGGIRSERDLLEAIVFPSASFVRSYEPVRVVTIDERTFNGILKKDAPDEIIVVVAADKEERIARADVASITPSAVSLMPSGLDQQLTPQDLADLVAFLRACK